jgi:hypothetical protein
MAMKTKLLAPALAALAVQLLGGCSSTKSPGKTPQGEDTPSDTTPPAVLSIEPADGAMRVSVHAKIAITFSEELDEATVDAAHASLRPVMAPANVAYDAARKTITLTPVPGMTNTTAPHPGLLNDTTYTVSLAGLKDKAGNEMPATTRTFTTYRNLPTESAVYDPWASSPTVDHFVRYTFDANGLETQEVTYAADSSNRIVLTATGLKTFQYANDQARTIDYDGPGSDGNWLTEEDDVAGRITLATHDADGNQTAVVDYNGPDVSWSLPASKVWMHTTTEYRSGLRVKDVWYDGPGADGVWLTSGDDIQFSTTYDYDASGNQIGSTNYDGTGAITGHTVNTFDANRHVIRMDSYGADDALTSSSTCSYDDAGNWTGGIYQGASGATTGWYTYEYDAAGNTTRYTYYSGPGTDGRWFVESPPPSTNDDVVFMIQSYETDL